ncbi:hypothetical protein BGZ82_005063, partial [Podila clonocystis]
SDQDSSSSSDDPDLDVEGDQDKDQDAGSNPSLSLASDADFQKEEDLRASDPDATDSEPDLPNRPYARQDVKPLQAKEKATPLKFEFNWNTREFWRQGLERREVIQFVLWQQYKLKDDGHSFYSESEDYRCTRYGSYTAIKKVENGDILLPKTVRRKTMKVGCPAT